jgi:4-hydroxy-3-methylbut-2-enyl diphosphate reductase
VDTVGVTSGASAPERLVDELVASLRGRGATEVREIEVVPEDVHFALPGTLRRDAEAARARPGG